MLLNQLANNVTGLDRTCDRAMAELSGACRVASRQLRCWGHSCGDGTCAAAPRCLLLLVSCERRRQSKADEYEPADVALGLEIGAVALQPVADRACCQRVAAVGNQPEKGEEQTQKGDLHRHLSALH